MGWEGSELNAHKSKLGDTASATRVEKSSLNSEARYDPRNKLNDLDNVEWLTLTKSVWESRPPARDELKEQHPATFAESDVEKLIRFFTKRGGKVLDPFLGSGSTLIACLDTGRDGVGIELIGKWVSIARRRLQRAKQESSYFQLSIDSFSGEKGEQQKPPNLEIIQGDSREVLKEFPPEDFDFIVTSPPYWAILTKAKDHKSRRERLSKGLPTKYSDDSRDLGNAPSYEVFLLELSKVFSECHRVLKPGKYMAVIVSDFRHGSRFIPYHIDIAREVEKVGFSLEGITILMQDSKNLYPYGMPYAFVSNIHHQNILIFRRNSYSESGQDVEGTAAI
jgi:DNA modification methylase